MVFCVLQDAGIVCEGYTRSQIQGLITITGIGCTLAGINTLILIKRRLIRISTLLLLLSLWFYVAASVISEAPRMTKEPLDGYDRAAVVLKILSQAGFLSYMLYLLSALLSCFTVDMHALACASFGVIAAVSVGLSIAPPWMASHGNGGREVYVDSNQRTVFDALARTALACTLLCHFILLVGVWKFRNYARIDESLDDQKSSLILAGTILGTLSSIMAVAKPEYFVTTMLRRVIFPVQVTLYLIYIVLGGHYLRPPWALTIEEEWDGEPDFRDSLSFDDSYHETARVPYESRYSTESGGRPLMRQSRTGYSDSISSDTYRETTLSRHGSKRFSSYASSDQESAFGHGYEQGIREGLARARAVVSAGHDKGSRPSWYTSEPNKRLPASRNSSDSLDSFKDAAESPDMHEMQELKATSGAEPYYPSKSQSAYRGHANDARRSRPTNERDGDGERSYYMSAPRKAVLYGHTDATAQMAERRHQRRDGERAYRPELASSPSRWEGDMEIEAEEQRRRLSMKRAGSSSGTTSGGRRQRSYQ